MASVAPIVTKGFGAPSLIVTMGYSSLPSVVVESIINIKGKPKKEYKEIPEEYIIDISLLYLNGESVTGIGVSRKKFIVSNENIFVSVSPEKLIYRKSKMYKIVISEIKKIRRD